ncbi:MAG: LamG-like jellyroll fold domain-containing protein [Luteolibacter sp.]
MNAPTRLRLIAACFFAGLMILAFSHRASAQTFVHPGLLHTAADFNRMKTKVDQSAQPWLSGWNALIGDGYSQLGATPRATAEVSRPGNVAQMYIDIYRTYQCALRWKVSGDTRYADQAVTFLNAWSSTMTTLTGNADRFLAAGIHGYEWANAGEIMRTYPGWAPADMARFQNLLVTIFYPMNHDFLTNHNGAAITNYWSNWDLCNIASMEAIGVFCDRADIYNEAMAYIYTGGGNGAIDRAIYQLHAGNLGQMQESGRDQGHATLSIALLGAVCEMAWNQGVDLYGYRNNRFLAGAEYVTKYNLGYDVPYVPYMWGTGQSGTWQIQSNVSSASRPSHRPMAEMIYNHYVNRRGLAAPFSKSEADQRRPEGSGGNGDQLGFGTLTFSRDPIATGANPKLTMVQSAGDVILSWWGSAYAPTYNIKRSTNPGGPYVTIAAGVTGDSTTYTDPNVAAPGQYYYVVTGVLASGQETESSNEVLAVFPAELGTWLKTDEANGTTAADSSGSGHDGTLLNGPTWTTGKTGNAISLDGVNDHVSLPSDVVSGLSDFTIATWVYLNDSRTWSRVFDFGGKPGSYMFLTPRSNTGGSRFTIATVYGYNEQRIDGPALPTGQWVHVAVTLSDRVATLYINGVEAGRNLGCFLQPFQLGETPQNWIGRSQFSNDPYLNGKVDDFRIYNYALGGDQLYALWGQSSNHAPSFTGEHVTKTDASEDGSYGNAAQTLATSASDPDGNVMTFTKLDGPAWLTVAANGALSGTPVNGDVGSGTFLVRVTDSSGAGSVTRLHINVTNTNDVPVWNPATLTKPPITRDQAYPAGVTLAADASDVDAPFGDTLTFSKFSGPAWLTVAANGALSGTPGAADVGVNSFTVRATDSVGAFADATLAITVYPFELRARLDFEDSLADSLGNFPGTATGSPVYGTGRINRGLLFDGVDDLVTLPAGIADSQDLTVAAWVYWNGGGDNQRVFDFGNNTNQYFYVSPRSGGAGLRFGIRNGGTEQQLNTTALATGCWVHVAVTLSGDTGRLYVDGALAATNTAMTINPSDFRPTLNYIGDSQWSADPLFKGRMDDFRVYNYALSATAVAALIDLVPAVPLDITANPNSSQINLAWAAVQGAQTYTVKRSVISGGPYTVLASGLTASSYSDTNVVSGTPYYYVISATNSKGTSADSAEITAVPSDLLAHLKFDDATGSTATDSSGNGWQAGFVNSPAWTIGFLKYGVNLPATANQHLTFSSGIVSGLTDFTISTWVNVSAFATWQRIFDFGTGTTNYMFLTTQGSSGAGKPRFAIRTPSIGEQGINSSIALTANTWNHVAVTRTGNTARLYINGVLAGTNTGVTLSPSSLGATTQNYLGKSQWPDPYLNGALDDFRIYSRALSDAEVATMASPTAEPPDGFVGHPIDGGARLTWNPANAVTTYTLKRSTMSGGPYTTVIDGLTALTYTDSGLVNDTTYFYVVRSVNPNGESVDSAEVAVVPSTLRIHLKLDETSGTLAADSSGRGTDATTVNSPTWISGKLANAVNLTSASSQYLALPANCIDDVTDCTIAVWVKPTTVTNVSRIVDFGTNTTPSSTAGTYFFLSPSAGGVLRFAITTSGYNNEQKISGSAALTAGVWSHVAVTLSGGVGRLYLNGDQVGSNSAMTLTPAALGGLVKNYLGKSQFSADPYLNGALDDFRIYARALNASEVGVLAAGELAAPSDLVATPGSAQIALLWNAVPGATSYTIRRASSAGGPYGILPGAVSGLGYTDTGLAPGATWYYTVAAHGLPGDGVISSPVSATTYTIQENWRLTNFATTESDGPAADDADPDGDGMTNAQEFAAGTDPKNPASVLHASSFVISGNDVILSFDSVAGKTYRLERSDTLESGSWTTVQDQISGTGGILPITDAGAAAHSTRFYRIVVVP